MAENREAHNLLDQWQRSRADADATIRELVAIADRLQRKMDDAGRELKRARKQP